MKRILAFVTILLLALVACSPAAEPEKEAVVEEKAPVAPPKVEETVDRAPEPEPEVGRQPPARVPPSEKIAPPEKVTVEPKEEMSPQLKSLLERSEGKLSSLQYLYGGTETGNLFLDTFYVRGDKMKIKKYDESYYVRENYYDNIYVHLSIGCCEEQSRCVSHNVDNTGKSYDVDVDALNVPKTPYQWVKEIPPNAEIIGPQTFNQRSVTYLKYTDSDGREVQMWVDDTYGVPHKIIVGEGDSQSRYQFNDMLFNGLRDNDFDAPCA